MTARVAFKQDDVTRACKGVVAAGLPVSKVVVRGSEIIILTNPEDAGKPERNPWHDDPEEA